VEALLVAVVLAVSLLALLREWLPPVVIFLLALGVLLSSNVITTQQAFAGFSNSVLFIIGSLFVVAHAVERTVNLAGGMQRVLGSGDNQRGTLLRLMTPVVLLSGFINNTPVVSMLVPQVGTWANKHGISASALLMPLSFAAVMGGTITLIGTSTNLAVSGLLAQYGYEPLGFFEITVVGLPIALAGIVLVALLGPKLVPERESVFDGDNASSQKFTFEATVEQPLAEKTVAQAGLRNMREAFLYALKRGETIISPVKPDTQLQEGDVLNFTGQAAAMATLNKHKGLTPPEEKHIHNLQHNRLAYYEAIIDRSSGLAGKTLKEVNFRSVYQAAVVSIHRSGERIDAKPGSVKLQAGDTLLLVADEHFQEHFQYGSDFLAIFPLGIQHAERGSQGLTVAGILLAALLAAITGLLPLAAAALLAAALLVAVGAISINQARNAIDFEVLILIGAAFGVAGAVSSSGLAEMIAGGLTDGLFIFGSVGVLAGVIIATIILTELITNNAAALLMLPIALNAASDVGVDPRMFAIAVAVAASASFLTPIGYQTNTMVYGPGGYKFSDYARLGLPLTAIVVLALLLVIPQLW
jgi:di/tricarboxylate transporter